MQTNRDKFASLNQEAAAIDAQVEKWKERIKKFQYGRNLKTRKRLSDLITEGSKKATEMRLLSHQNSQK
jgi:hypothetical protein